MFSNPELNPFSSFNIQAAEISPFFFVNLMLLMIFFLLFYLFYAILKIFEFLIIRSFKNQNNTGNYFSKFNKFILKFLRLIDIGIPLLGYLLFLVPICVFSCINLRYASSTSQTLFNASTFFSIIFFIISLAVIGLMAYYIYNLFLNIRRYVSTSIEHYCINSHHDNMTLHHFPKKLRTLDRTSKEDIYNQRFGPYNLHLLNFVNERNNDQINLEELYKHIIDEKEKKTHSK